jgi:hypothetical protein
MTVDRADRPVRRRAGWIVLAVGVVLAVAGIVLPFILGAAFVSYPGGPIDQTIHPTGIFTWQVNPATLEKQVQPSQGLCLDSRLRTVETTGNTVILQRDDSESVGPLRSPPHCRLPLLHFTQRYAIDQDSVRNVASQQAYAYAPGSTVDRSPAYSVNLPLGTGNGPYLMWDDATGQTYPLTPQGSVTQDGLQLRRFGGRLANAPASAAFLAALAPLDLPSTRTLDQLGPQLTAAGVDLNILPKAIRSLDQATEQPVVNSTLNAIRIDYVLTTTVELLVYPKTGTIVSLESVEQTLAMRPDIVGLGRVLAIMSQPKYATDTLVGTVADQLANLVIAPPTTPVLTQHYTQQQDQKSVAAVAAVAKSRGDDIDTLTVTIPLIVGLVGLVLILVGVALLVWGRRRTGVAEAR